MDKILPKPVIQGPYHQMTSIYEDPKLGLEVVIKKNDVQDIPKIYIFNISLKRLQTNV